MAIIIDRKITINNDKATLDRPLYLYIGDGDITCLFTIEEKKKAATFGSITKTNSITENASYGEVRIYKPDPGSDATSRLVFTDRAEIIDDKLQVIFSYKNIDDFSEAGVHKLQIHLYDDDDSERNRFTIPPIDINVLLPVGYDNNTIDEAIVGYSLLDARGVDIPTFDEEGNYNVTIWEIGDIITKNKLNKIEDALYEIKAADNNFVTNEALDIALDGKADSGHKHNANTITGLSRVATTGSYNDLSNKPNFATTSQLDSKADVNHTHSGYATNDHTHSNYAPTSHTHSDYLTQSALSNYATKSYVDNSGFLTSIPAAYITEGELENHLATKTYATTAYVNTAIQNAGGFSGGGGDGTIDTSIYATKIELNAKADKTHTHEDYLTTAKLDGYASKAYVDDAVANIRVDVNLDEYAKKSEIPTIPTNVSYFTNDSSYATEQYVNNAVSNVQVDLSGYVTTETMNTALDGKANENHEHEDYALKTDIPELVIIPGNVGAFTNDVGYATNTEVNKAVSDLENKITNKNYATKSELPTKVVDLDDHGNYALKTEVNESINSINSNIEDNYAKKSDIPTSTEQLTNDSGFITSNKDNDGNYYITRIEIVDELPDYEEPGVLYIVRA